MSNLVTLPDSVDRPTGGISTGTDNHTQNAKKKSNQIEGATTTLAYTSETRMNMNEREQ